MDLSPSKGIQHLKRAVLEKRLLNPDRRKVAFALLGGLAALVGVYIVSERQRVWVTVGPLSVVPINSVLPFEYDGQYAYLRKTADGTIIALSQRCSHQGCRIAFDLPSNQFRCPCHQGVFTAQGDVVSGRPIRALERFATRRDGDNIQIFI
jgi:Rieske Fe-S protein